MNEDGYELPTLDEVVAIGKQRLVSGRKHFHLHFLLYRAGGPFQEPGFSICCIEFGLFSWAKTQDAARDIMSDITHAFMLRGKQSSGRQHIMNELRSESRESFWALYRQVAFAIGEPAIPNIQSELDEMLQRPAGTLDRERIEQWMQSMRDMQEQLREREEVITTLKVDIDELRRWIAANEAAVV